MLKTSVFLPYQIRWLEKSFHISSVRLLPYWAQMLTVIGAIVHFCIRFGLPNSPARPEKIAHSTFPRVIRCWQPVARQQKLYSVNLHSDAVQWHHFVIQLCKGPQRKVVYRPLSSEPAKPRRLRATWMCLDPSHYWWPNMSAQWHWSIGTIDSTDQSSCAVRLRSKVAPCYSEGKPASMSSHSVMYNRWSGEGHNRYSYCYCQVFSLSPGVASGLRPIIRVLLKLLIAILHRCRDFSFMPCTAQLYLLSCVNTTASYFEDWPVKNSKAMACTKHRRCAEGCIVAMTH